ncbi:MAG: TolC family protein, partial [Phycisphaerales bacterium]
MNERIDERQRLAAVGRWGLTLVVILGAGGCGIPEVKREPKMAALAEKLDTIDTVQLEEKSKSEPVTIEKATENLAKQIAEPNRPQREIKFTLDEVRAAALANNLDLKVEMIDPAIARENLDIERARYESTFFGSARYGRSDQIDGGAVSSRRYEAGVTTPLQTGGEITASVPVTDVGGVSEAAASVSVVQSLLRGAGTRVNLYAIQLAAYAQDRVDASTKLRAIYILSEADIAYWSLYTARKQLDVSREQYKLAQDQLGNARHKVEAGSAAKIEIIRAESGLASRLDTMISNETAVRNRERDLKRIMNRTDLPLNEQIDMIPMTDPDPKGMELDSEALVAAAMKNRMEMAVLESQLASNDIGVAVAKNNLLPKLDADYTFEAGGVGTSQNRAVRNIFDETLADHSVGVSATIPLGNRAAEARLRQAHLAKVQT